MIFLILFLGFLLRLISINQSLWLDEAINALAVKNLPLKDLIFKYSIGDFHPPLYHILMKGWVTIFGYSEIALRMPSVFFGVASIFVIYMIGKKLFDEKTGLIAATLLATAPLHIYYSQEARMYMLAAFLCLLSVYFFISILKTDKLYYWIGFVASTILLLYSDYLPYLMIPTYVIFLYVFRKRIRKSTFRSFFPAFLLIFIAILPWFFVFPKQFSTGLSAASASPAWAQVVGPANFKNLLLTFVKFSIGRISADNNTTYFLLFAPVAVFVSAMFAVSAFRTSRLRSFIYFWLFLPVAAAFIGAFFVPIFAYFRLLFVLAAFYLILASAINTVNWVAPTRILLMAALSINLGASIIYFVNPKFQRENWKAAASYVLSNSNKYSVVLFESDTSLPPFDYYNSTQVTAKGALDSYTPNTSKVAENVKKFTEGKTRVFLFQYLSGITDSQGILFQQITKAGFTNTKTKDITGVGFIYQFERRN